MSYLRLVPALFLASLLAAPALSERTATTPSVQQKTPSPVANPAVQGVKKKAKVRGNATVLDSKKVMKMLLPDLALEVVPPTSPAGVAWVRIRNLGAGEAKPFQVTAAIKGACEAGKLVTQIPASWTQKTQGPIPAGGQVQIQLKPSSGSWTASPCYYQISAKADPAQQLAETNDGNNNDTASYCNASGSSGCY